MAVSVILPSLNVGTYIDACLKSVVSQSLKKIEIVCVDAGSTDGTFEILKKYEQGDSRIKVLTSQKKSYGHQVNLGMQQALGKYVAIVDTDDMIRQDMYEILYQIAEDNNADFVKANYEEISKKKGDIRIGRTVRILEDDKCYHRLLNMEENPFCFLSHITATWSGIYKREFLEENHILHNETPGASYQDTGFWFQTYMFAKRAYFVNQPFYRYRVDNPGSSVNSKSKVYSICDEFDFILRRIKECELTEAFQDIFCYVFYRKYKRNLERIAKEYHIVFLKRFSKDFKGLFQEGLLHTEKWTSNSREEIKEILDGPESYYEKILHRRTQFLNEVQQSEQIILYGFGKVGKLLYDNIERKDKIVSFAVTSLPGGSDKESVSYQGIPVRELKALQDYCESACLVIAVKTPEYEATMEKEAGKYGFRNVARMPFGIFDFE